MTEQLELDTSPVIDIRALLRDRITEVIAAFDAHDPGVYLAADIDADEDQFHCPGACPGFIGPKAAWEQHLADRLADALIGEPS